MRNVITLSVAALLLGLWVSPAPAAVLLYSFEGSMLGGTGSGTMSFDGLGTNVLTVTVDNTSPLQLNAPASGPNAPGISGMGFNLVGLDIGDLLDWSVTASEWDGSGFAPLTIGEEGNSSLDWSMGTNVTGDITLGFLPNNGGVADGMIYNPAAVTLPSSAFPGGENDIYFSTATLVLTFADGVEALLDDSDEYSPFLRMQRVGENAGGSLKLGGVLDDGDGGIDQVVPEPASLAIWALGLLGLCGLGWVRRKR